MTGSHAGGIPGPGHRRTGAGVPLVVLLPGRTEASPDLPDLRRTAASLAGRPWIAVLDGRVPPAHLELALGADLLVAGRGTRFLSPGGRAPSLPGTGWRLAARLGVGGALAFWTAPRPWSAARAARRGLVDLVAADPVGRACAVRRLLADHAEVAGFLHVLEHAGPGLAETAGIALERVLFSLAFARDEARAGARAFLDSRPARR